jgi:hypothetical protein
MGNTKSSASGTPPESSGTAQERPSEPISGDGIDTNIPNEQARRPSYYQMAKQGYNDLV